MAAASVLSRMQLPQYMPAAPAVMLAIFMTGLYRPRAAPRFKFRHDIALKLSHPSAITWRFFEKFGRSSDSRNRLDPQSFFPAACGLQVFPTECFSQPPRRAMSCSFCPVELAKKS